jgi:hypothetical protein
MNDQPMTLQEMHDAALDEIVDCLMINNWPRALDLAIRVAKCYRPALRGEHVESEAA